MKSVSISCEKKNELSGAERSNFDWSSQSALACQGQGFRSWKEESLKAYRCSLPSIFLIHSLAYENKIPIAHCKQEITAKNT